MSCNAFAYAPVWSLLRHTASYVIAVVKPEKPSMLTSPPPSAVLLDDFVLIEKLAMQNREPVPARMVDAKGTAASG